MKNEEFFLGEELVIGFFECFEFLEASDALADGSEVGEHATQPTLGHVRHTYATSLLNDGLLSLLLGADIKNAATVGNSLFDELVSIIDECE